MGYMHIGNMEEAQRLIRDATSREDALREENARLLAAVEMRGETIAQAQATIARLRAAIKPFAELSGIYVRRAETFGWKDTDGVFGAADITKDVTIRVADCRAAIKALGEES